MMGRKDDRTCLPQSFSFDFISISEMKLIFIAIHLSFVLFGCYFSYDLPAALHYALAKPFQAESNQAEFEFKIQLLYSIYSILNVFMPLAIGSILERIGTQNGLLIISGLIVLGQGICTIGIAWESYPIVLAGRIVFGAGGETLSVVQQQLSIFWFQNSNLAFVMAMNVSVARVGSFCNNVVSPFLERVYGIRASFIAGTVLCLLSFASSLYLYQQYQKDPRGEEDQKIDHEEKDEDQSLLVATSKHSSSSSSSYYWKSLWKSLLSYPKTFWMLLFLMVLYYSIMVPFNTIEATFVGGKFLDNDFAQARAWMSLSDLIAIVLAPVFGLFQDRFGHRIHYLFAGSVFYVLGCSLLLFSASIHPAIALMSFAVAYVCILCLWSSISKLVPISESSLALGIATCVNNLALTITPLFVAFLATISNGSYYWEMVFFLTLAATSLLGVIGLKFFDQQDVLTIK